MKISIHTLRLEQKRKLFSVLSDQVRRQVTNRGLSEEEVLSDFKSWRKRKRATRHRP
jgi:hypothetical protein